MGWINAALGWASEKVAAWGRRVQQRDKWGQSPEAGGCKDCISLLFWEAHFFLGLFVEATSLDLSRSPALGLKCRGRSICTLWSYPGYHWCPGAQVMPNQAEGPGVIQFLSPPHPSSSSALLTLNLMLWASLEYLPRGVRFLMTLTWGPCVT